ncbi:MAG TPA: lysophospholipid acyltransferase family protein [Gemmatimonadaceae bacterium]
MYSLPPALPRVGGPVRRAIGRAILRVMGWRFSGDIPNARQLVIIVAPHTSNWDFVVGFAAKIALSLRAKYLGKDSLFRAPWGWFFRITGGIPVDRTNSHRVVEQVVAEFARRDQMVLALAPEGTRKKVTEWRTGFWHIARGAGVPIVMVAFDFGTREIRLGPTLVPGDDLAADMARIRAHFATVRGRNPENQ